MESPQKLTQIEAKREDSYVKHHGAYQYGSTSHLLATSKCLNRSNLSLNFVPKNYIPNSKPQGTGSCRERAENAAARFVTLFYTTTLTVLSLHRALSHSGILIRCRNSFILSLNINREVAMTCGYIWNLRLLIFYAVIILYLRGYFVGTL